MEKLLKNKLLVRVERLSESDLDSDESVVFMETGGSGQGSDVSVKRKRKSSEGGCVGSVPTSADETAFRPSVSSKRGRGRPPTTGQYVGLAKAKAELNKVKREELRLQAEKEVAHLARRERDVRGSRPIASMAKGLEARTAANITKEVLDGLEVVQKVATNSSNLKGTFVRALKEAVASIREAVLELQDHSVDEESRSLRTENARMKTELEDLRKEVDQVKEEMVGWRIKATLPAKQVALEVREEPTRPVASSEELERNIMVQVGTMVNARLDALEERLLPQKRMRPPLAADQQNEQSVPVPVPESSLGLGGTEKKQRGKTALSKPAIPPEPKVLPTTPAVSTEPAWTTVVKRGKKNKAKTTVTSSNQPSAQSQSQARAKRLQTPRSSAVVITLHEEAEKKGATYAEVIIEARKKIKLDEIGISALNYRKAVTGGVIFELPGAGLEKKADEFAKRLREVLPADSVRITRPEKSVELHVSGLDDSVVREDVTASVASTGGCSEDQIRCGEIRHGPRGFGEVWLKCPAAAAKIIARNGRLLVGWVSARVRLLESRPLTCFRCLEVGHVRKTCTTEEDRSGLCYRCGKLGHQSRQCTEEPRCVLCAAVKKPAEHRLGSKSCPAYKDKKKKRRDGSKAPATASRTTAAAETREDAVPMQI